MGIRVRSGGGVSLGILPVDDVTDSIRPGSLSVLSVGVFPAPSVGLAEVEEIRKRKRIAKVPYLMVETATMVEEWSCKLSLLWKMREKGDVWAREKERGVVRGCYIWFVQSFGNDHCSVLGTKDSSSSSWFSRKTPESGRRTLITVMLSVHVPRTRHHVFDPWMFTLGMI